MQITSQPHSGAMDIHLLLDAKFSGPIEVQKQFAMHANAIKISYHVMSFEPH